MTTKRITDPDERQATPAVIAAEMGWKRPRGQHGWSWAALLEIAHRRYEENRARATEDAA